MCLNSGGCETTLLSRSVKAGLGRMGLAAAPVKRKQSRRAMMPGSEDHGPPAPPSGKPRLIDQVRDRIRVLHYSRRTEKTYVFWIRYFILYMGKRHPASMGAREVSDFLSFLASERKVAAATQNQALSALLFLYKQILGVNLPWMDDMIRAKLPVRLPTVLTEDEARRLLAQLQGGAWLMTSLLYGAGLRQAECLALRVKDVDFAYRQLFIHDAKGGKDRVTMLPESAVQPLQAHLGRGRAP